VKSDTEPVWDQLLCLEYTGFRCIKVKLTKYLPLGLNLKFGLYRILYYLWLGVDRFHYCHIV
jgi:hypothetical protein